VSAESVRNIELLSGSIVVKVHFNDSDHAKQERVNAAQQVNSGELAVAFQGRTMVAKPMPRLPPMEGKAAALPKGAPLPHLDVPPLPLPVVSQGEADDGGCGHGTLTSARSVGSDGGILKEPTPGSPVVHENTPRMTFADTHGEPLVASQEIPARSDSGPPSALVEHADGWHDVAEDGTRIVEFVVRTCRPQLLSESALFVLDAF